MAELKATNGREKGRVRRDAAGLRAMLELTSGQQGEAFIADREGFSRTGQLEVGTVEGGGANGNYT